MKDVIITNDTENAIYENGFENGKQIGAEILSKKLQYIINDKEYDQKHDFMDTKILIYNVWKQLHIEHKSLEDIEYK